MSRGDLSLSVDEQLRFAIANKRLMQLRYNDSLRVVEPHDYGVKKGAAMLLAYQRRSPGGSAQKAATGWRLFDVSKIAECLILEEMFRGSRGDVHQQHHVWDVLYARVA